MSDTPKIDREALLARLRELVAIEREEFLRSDCTVFVNGVERIRPPLDSLDLDSLSVKELASLESGLLKLAKFRAYSRTPEFQVELEHAMFAEYLKERQGTQLPDFNQSYRERDELDRKLFPRPDGEA